MKQEHILVCLSSSPANRHIIEAAKDLSDAFKAQFTALYIDTGQISQSNHQRLEHNIQLAESLGAKIEIIHGNDISLEIIDYVMLHDVTRLVLGKGTLSSTFSSVEDQLTEQLKANNQEIEIYIIPDTRQALTTFNHPFQSLTIRFSDAVICLLILAAVTAIGFLFKTIGVQNSNIITLYILAVLLISIISSQWIYGLLSSIIIVVIFNYLFIEPIFSFRAYDAGYFVTFAVMLISAIISSSLASRLKDYATSSGRRAYRTKILFDTNKLLSQSESEEDIMDITTNQLRKLLERTIIYYYNQKNVPHIKMYDEMEISPVEDDQRAIDYVWSHHGKAGAGTDHFNQAVFCYYGVRTQNNMFGVIGIAGGKKMDDFEESVMISIIDECALEMENKKNERDRKHAEMQAENEKLRANLLRTLSHDLRSPLTSISGHAHNLLDGVISDDNTRQQVYEDIYDDSLWLIDTIENLLAITRLEEHGVNIHQDIDVLNDVVEDALTHCDQNIIHHQLSVDLSDDMILCQMDVKLIGQVIVNLVNNAIKYTPEQSHIKVSTFQDEQNAYVCVEDDGDGIDENAPVFDMFYTGDNDIADSKRSLGLGLYLCKMIIDIHGGTISFKNVEPHGACFTFTLPVYPIASE